MSTRNGSRRKKRNNGLTSDDVPQLHRRRSSLPNIKLVPLTMAQRRDLARRKRQEEKAALELKKQQDAEAKRQRAKQLRQQTRNKDREHARKVTILGSCVHCRYCDDMIEEMEFDEHKVSHPTQIRERIWLGNAENSQSLHDIKKCGITHVLNCTREIDLPKNISKKIKSFKRISIADKNNETILDYINESSGFIEKALGDNKFHVVFVHCREGRSRSVSFLSAYLMWKEKVSFHAVLSDITSKRHIVLPNNKFYGELEKLDKQLVYDRKNMYKRYGKPSNAFKLKKLKGNAMTQMNNAIYQSVFGYPEKYGEEMKYEEYPEILEKRESARGGLLSPANAVNTPNSRRRRSSLTDIALIQFDATSPLNRASMRMSIGVSMSSANSVRSSNGSNLSPVAGSPSTKKKRQSDPWKDAVQANKTKKKSKKKESSSVKKSSKKKKKSKARKRVKDDLDVEEAMDISDVFGVQNEDDNEAKKRKRKKSNKKKKKKKTSR